LFTPGSPIVDGIGGLLWFVGGSNTADNQLNLFYATGTQWGTNYALYTYGGGAYPSIDNLSATLSNVTYTPEPVTLILFGTGLAGIGGFVRRRLAA